METMKPGDLVGLDEDHSLVSLTMFNDEGNWIGNFDRQGLVLEIVENLIIRKIPTRKTFARILSGGIIGWMSVRHLRVIS